MIWRAIVAGAVLLAITGGGAIVYHQTRGIRNNNPGNIRKGNDWQGEVPGSDPEFETFSSAEYGIRALAILLRNYSSRYGLRTVEAIITRWAPPTENNTAAYVAHVASHLGVNPAMPIDVEQYMPQLVEAIIKHENGIQPYSRATIATGITMAGIAVPSSYA